MKIVGIGIRHTVIPIVFSHISINKLNNITNYPQSLNIELSFSAENFSICVHIIIVCNRFPNIILNAHFKYIFELHSKYIDSILTNKKLSIPILSVNANKHFSTLCCNAMFIVHETIN